MLVAGFPAGAFAANCYIVATAPGEQCVIIDPGQDAVPGIEEILAEHRLRPAAVLLTHGHIDHVWSVAPVCGAKGIPAYIHEAMIARYLRGAIARDMPEVELAPYVAPWLGPVGQPAFYRQIAQMDERYTDEVETQLDRIRCPVTILWGEEDGWIPAETGHRLHALIPHSQLQLIPAAGHFLQEDAPERVAYYLGRFFSKTAKQASVND